MGATTNIEWTDSSWNPVRGCSRVSPGCENCYAERMAARFSGPGQPYEGLAFMKLKTLGEDDDNARTVPRWTGKVRIVTDHLADPLRWRRPRRVFVNSMSDLFHEGLSDEQIAAVFGIMAASPSHTFQILTKRAERMLAWFSALQTDDDGPGVSPHGHRMLTLLSEAASCLRLHEDDHERAYDMLAERAGTQWPLRNVWLGVSVEDQKRADERVPLLLRAPAAVRFVSAEPLLGPVNLRSVPAQSGPIRVDALAGSWAVPSNADGRHRQEPRLHWVIAGAESGPGARPMDEAWVRDLREQCETTGTNFFYKQRLDERGRKVSLPLLDGRQSRDMPEVR